VIIRAAAGIPRVVKRFLFATGATGILVGCVQTQVSSSAHPGQDTFASTLVSPANARLPTDPSDRTPTRPLIAVAQLQGLRNLTGQDLVSRIGTPDFVRRDPPAEIWQYRNATCVLDVFLFQEDSGTRVAYLASRDRQNPGVPVNACTPFAPPSQTAAAPALN